jgi:hypothetical protein
MSLRRYCLKIEKGYFALVEKEWKLRYSTMRHSELPTHEMRQEANGVDGEPVLLWPGKHLVGQDTTIHC